MVHENSNNYKASMQMIELSEGNDEEHGLPTAIKDENLNP